MACLPRTSEALVRGELSGPQLKEIAATAGADPGAEGDLLEAARRHGLKGLKDLKEQCLRVRARSVTETEARARYEHVARVAAAVGAEADAVFREARRAGHREPTAAYAADALVALVTGTAASGTGPSPSPSRSRRNSGT